MRLLIMGRADATEVQLTCLACGELDAPKLNAFTKREPTIQLNETARETEGGVGVVVVKVNEVEFIMMILSWHTKFAPGTPIVNVS